MKQELLLLNLPPVLLGGGSRVRIAGSYVELCQAQPRQVSVSPPFSVKGGSCGSCLSQQAVVQCAAATWGRSLRACGGGRAGISQDNSVFGVRQELCVADLPTVVLECEREPATCLS